MAEFPRLVIAHRTRHLLSRVKILLHLNDAIYPDTRDSSAVARSAKVEGGPGAPNFAHAYQRERELRLASHAKVQASGTGAFVRRATFNLNPKL
jgi:hypothetical protein